MPVAQLVAEAPQHGKRILVVRTDRLGDVILSLPMLPLLRRRFPGCYITMLLRKYPAELIEDNPDVNEILLYDDGERHIPLDRMRKAIRDRSFDIAIIVHPTPRLAWLIFQARIPVRIGTGYRFYSLLFNTPVYEHRKGSRLHEVEHNLNLLKPLGCPLTGEPQFDLVIPADVRAKVDKLVRSLSVDGARELIVVHPGTGGSAKEWPPDCLGRLAARFQAERNSQILVTGTNEEMQKIQPILSLTGGKAISLAGRLTLKELAAVVERADLFVSNSTGPLHIAVAVGTPVLAMFPQIPAMGARRWGPYTARKRVLVPDRPANCRKCAGSNATPCECMMSISVEQAYAAAGSLLAECNAGKSVSHV